MLLGFFLTLREAGLKPGLGEFLALLEGMRERLVEFDREAFYFLSRTVLVKDESQFDRFDRAFGVYFNGIDENFEKVTGGVPEEWLKLAAEKLLTDEDKAKVKALGGLDKLLELLKERLNDQKEAHSGGNKWIGTRGTSPFGHSGYNPEGIRFGGESKNRSAVKIWDKREFRNLDDNVALGTRNIKMALRRLRKFAREGAPDLLDLDGTIESTARNAGYLDLKMQPERHNAVKVLLMLDVGGSMDPHIRVCEELFSACKTEFKHLEYFYFHNFVYESLWRDNRRRAERTPTFDVMHRYTSDYKLIFVGDAQMSPYEIVQPGGSIEHWNEEAGAVWMQRLVKTFPHVVWINPDDSKYWDNSQSAKLTQELLGPERMFPMTLDGLDRAMRRLRT